MVQLRVRGSVELEGSVEAQAVLAVIAEERGPVVLDLSEAEFLDSRFLRRLLDVERRRSALGRRLAIIAPDSALPRIFRLADLRRRFTCYPDQRAAHAELTGDLRDERGPEPA